MRSLWTIIILTLCVIYVSTTQSQSRFMCPGTLAWGHEWVVLLVYCSKSLAVHCQSWRNSKSQWMIGSAECEVMLSLQMQILVKLVKTILLMS